MVMNLSPLEIVEDDCGVKYGFNIEIQDKKHGKSLVNRWFFDTSDSNKEKIFTEEMIESNIGKTINFRSSISCKTPNMRLCKKCFGSYKNIKSPYVGILAGQYIAERLTQLAMSSFHVSGSCSLIVDKKLKNFIQNHLIKIDNINETSKLVFDSSIPEELISVINGIPGFINYDENKTVLTFENQYNVENEDVTKTIKEMNKLLNTENERDLTPPNETYARLIKHILNVGFVYSTFVELVLANAYVNPDEIILRYAVANGENPKIHKKYSIKKIHNLIDSGILSFLYEPNNRSLTDGYEKFSNIDMDKISVFERIWLGKL